MTKTTYSIYFKDELKAVFDEVGKALAYMATTINNPDFYGIGLSLKTNKEAGCSPSQIGLQ